MKYIHVDHPSDGLTELCDKELLATTKDANLYWANKDLFNTGVFEPKHMMCMEKEKIGLLKRKAMDNRGLYKILDLRTRQTSKKHDILYRVIL